MSFRSSVLAVVVMQLLCFAGAGRFCVAEEKSVSQQRRDFLLSLAREHELTSPDSDTEFRLEEKPVVYYSNPAREQGTSDGLTLLWLQRELPIAVSSFSLRRPNDSLRFECVSFSESSLEFSRNGVVTWAPPSWQTGPQTLPVSTPPASSETRRLSQFRQLARKFDASCTRRGEVTPLRLLPQPLYRFRDTETGVVDGALFAFVISNDPELLLRLEAVENDGALVWKYSFARMTSLEVKVELDGSVVWDVPDFYENGKSSTQPYIEEGLRSVKPVPF